MIPGSGRPPGEGKGYPLQYSGLENSMDSPWGHKESDMTERLSLHFVICHSANLSPSQLAQFLSNQDLYVWPWRFGQPEL